MRHSGEPRVVITGIGVVSRAFGSLHCASGSTLFQHPAETADSWTTF
jgi:hypothetical protein